ncbi:MAG: thioredoxin family protein [Pirellula sp.]
MLRKILIGIALVLVAGPTYAGKFNFDRNIGDSAPAWNDLPGTDDKKHSMKDFDDKDVLVVVFTCNSCPYAVDYEQRINTLAKKYSSTESRVGLVAINVNKIEADLLPAMIKRAKERDFVFPYLFDETQQIAKDYGAGRTPEVFVLNKARQIVYMGSLDDNAKEDKVKVQYVQDAIDAMLAGKPIAVTETAPIGCAIRYARQRR